jgi:hypothetical protein
VSVCPCVVCGHTTQPVFCCVGAPSLTRTCPDPTPRIRIEKESGDGRKGRGKREAVISGSVVCVCVCVCKESGLCSNGDGHPHHITSDSEVSKGRPRHKEICLSSASDPSPSHERRRVVVVFAPLVHTSHSYPPPSLHCRGKATAFSSLTPHTHTHTHSLPCTPTHPPRFPHQGLEHTSRRDYFVGRADVHRHNRQAPTSSASSSPPSPLSHHTWITARFSDSSTFHFHLQLTTTLVHKPISFGKRCGTVGWVVGSGPIQWTGPYGCRERIGAPSRDPNTPASRGSGLVEIGGWMHWAAHESCHFISLPDGSTVTPQLNSHPAPNSMHSAAHHRSLDKCWPRFASRMG